jgi:uncharacterized DUF497 family protein
MEFEWDDSKNTLNQLKHGVRFEDAKLIFNGPVVTTTDNRRDYGECREISIGALTTEIVITAIHTDRNGRKRIISARKANRKERGMYYDYIKRTLG